MVQDFFYLGSLGVYTNLYNHALSLATYQREWTPQAAIVDAVFLFSTMPMRRTNTTAEFAKVLFDRFVREHVRAGTREVNFIFDKPTKGEIQTKGDRTCSM